MPAQPEGLLGLGMQLQHQGSLPRDTQQMDADTVLEAPAGRRLVKRVPLLRGQGGLDGLTGLPNAIRPGRIDQHADGKERSAR